MEDPMTSRLPIISPPSPSQSFIATQPDPNPSNTTSSRPAIAKPWGKRLKEWYLDTVSASMSIHTTTHVRPYTQGNQRYELISWACILLSVLFCTWSWRYSQTQTNTHLGTSVSIQDHIHDNIGTMKAPGKVQVDTVLKQQPLYNLTRTYDPLTNLSNKFCILQPILTRKPPQGEAWGSSNLDQHTGLDIYLRSFLNSLDMMEDTKLDFHLYYGHDADDAVLGNRELRLTYDAMAMEMVKNHVLESRANSGGAHTDHDKELKLEFHYVQLYELHSRINAIWNELAARAYQDGCDYFFLSNDDMIFLTKGWASKSVGYLNSKRGNPQCKYFGIVRFKDEWGSWAIFTFHVSTRLHMEIFDRVYYPIPFLTTHNDLWIYRVYFGWKADHLDRGIRVRNRILKTNSTEVAEPRYQYDDKSQVWTWVNKGRSHVMDWLRANHPHKHYCDRKGSLALRVIKRDKTKKK